MNGFFRIDGPLYRIGNIIYYLLISNLLWFIFSIPIVTIGASTTALFYVTGKAIREDDTSIFKNFWKSFRQNFKQSTIIWLIYLVISIILYTNIRNIELFGNMARFIYPAQLVILAELVFMGVYIFPLISRYNITIKDAFRSSFFIANRHIFSTILCGASLAAILFLLYKFPGFFILMPVSLYAMCSFMIIYKIFCKYVPEEKKIAESQALEQD